MARVFSLTTTSKALALVLACSVGQPLGANVTYYRHVPPNTMTSQIGLAPHVQTISYNAALRLPVLNKNTFHASVRGERTIAEHWFVMYCVNWAPTCQQLREAYVDYARSNEDALNADSLLMPRVRFAEVECAMDKVLCNEQEIEYMPRIQHWHQGRMVKLWRATTRNMSKLEARIVNWLAEETEFTEVVERRESSGDASTVSATQANATAENVTSANASSLNASVLDNSTEVLATLTEFFEFWLNSTSANASSANASAANASATNTSAANTDGVLTDKATVSWLSHSLASDNVLSVAVSNPVVTAFLVAPYAVALVTIGVGAATQGNDILARVRRPLRAHVDARPQQPASPKGPWSIEL